MIAFERITISSKEILEYPAAKRILNNLEKYDLLPSTFKTPEVIDTQTVTHQLAFQAPKNLAPNNHAVALGKRHLHLTIQPGTFLKQCPGSNNMLCCHYHIVNMVSNCPFDCSYCYLQTYLNQPLITFYVNEDDIFNQVRTLCQNSPVEQLRIGTGEISDSLALDPITEFSNRLAEVMAPFKNVRLELKTKSKNVEHLFKIPRKDHVVIAWSMNPPEIVNTEEHGTARFEERCQAAIKATQAGFDVAFHFDPMILFDGWQEAYQHAASYLLEQVPHEKIRWISIGGLRYLPQLRAIAYKRRPESKIFLEDSATGQDGKIRYLRGARTEMFQFLNQVIKQKAPSVYTYLCMETKPVWEKALGRLPDRGF